MSIYTAYQHQSEAFQPEFLKGYRLRLLVREHLLQYAVLSPESRIIAVKEYRTDSDMGQAEFLEAVYQQDYFLKEDYQSVQVINGTLGFSLIPTRYFQPSRVKEFAGALIKDQFDADHLEYCSVDRAGATAVYAIPFSIKQKCDFYFQEPDYIPSCEPLINMASFLSETYPDQLLLTLFDNQFVLTGMKGGKLCLCNAYDYQTATDIVYFTQLVTQTLGFQDQRIALLVNGDVEAESPLYEELREFMPGLVIPQAHLMDRFETQSEKLPHGKYAYLSF